MLKHHVSHRQGSIASPGMTSARRRRTVTLVVLLGLLVLGVLTKVASAIEVPLPTKEQMVYGDFPVVGRRIAVWAIAQLHLMFGAFVVGVPLFILIIEIMGAATKSQRYDDLAHEFTTLLSVAFSTTATFGGILVFFLIGLYPTFTNFLARIFFPSMVVYVFLFFGESFSMYLYYYGWESLKGTSRRFGAVLGTAILTLSCSIQPCYWSVTSSLGQVLFRYRMDWRLCYSLPCWRMDCVLEPRPSCIIKSGCTSALVFC